MSNYPKAYGTVAVAVAFMAGILLTLGFKDFYPVSTAIQCFRVCIS